MCASAGATLRAPPSRHLAPHACCCAPSRLPFALRTALYTSGAQLALCHIYNIYTLSLAPRQRRGRRSHSPRCAPRRCRVPRRCRLRHRHHYSVRCGQLPRRGRRRRSLELAAEGGHVARPHGRRVARGRGRGRRRGLGDGRRARSRGSPRACSDTSTSQRTASMPCRAKLGIVTSMNAIIRPTRNRHSKDRPISCKSVTLSEWIRRSSSSTWHLASLEA
jgi:hypothetical protein